MASSFSYRSGMKQTLVVLGLLVILLFVSFLVIRCKLVFNYIKIDVEESLNFTLYGLSFASSFIFIPLGRACASVAVAVLPPPPPGSKESPLQRRHKMTSYEK